MTIHYCGEVCDPIKVHGTYRINKSWAATARIHGISITVTKRHVREASLRKSNPKLVWAKNKLTKPQPTIKQKDDYGHMD
jgi:hypothetical protein